MRLAVDVLGALSWLIPLAAASSEPTAPFTHDQVLAAVSMAAAVAGCYAALELGARAQARTGLAGAIWLAAAGLLLGAGVWAMHFVALVALETPLLRGFEVGPTVASCVIALVFGASGFVLGGRHWRSWRYGVAGVWFGVGSILMHYVGMQGLLIDADLSYRALFVGGCVRNALLGRPVADVDMATDAEPRTVMALAAAAGLHPVPTGLDHGTVTVVSDGRPFEVTTFRRDVETFGRRAAVAFSADLAEDASRRDFTMNALYAEPDGAVVDPLDRMAYDVHQYLDRDSSGRSAECVAGAGGRLAPFTRWARQHGKRGFLGEFGAGPGEGCARELAALLEHIRRNRDVWVGWTCWAGGPWWGDYPLSLEPASLEAPSDRPQMAVLRQYFE